MGGYITDLVYPGLFHRETAPRWMAAAVAAIGQKMPDCGGPFRYLDLGCGVGLNTALLAAANPQGRFVGVDMNPRHVEQGQTYAALLPNLSFVQAGFDEVADGGVELPDAGQPFDFIVAQGVYSWIAPDWQADLRRIVRDRLAPGGLAYLHYTAHPGHSVFAGAQAMMRRVAATMPGDSSRALSASLAVLRALEQGGAGYLHQHPAVGKMLFDGGADAAALAHDLLAPDWAALHAADVIEAMEEAECAFVGSAALLDNVDALSVPGAALDLIARIGDLKARETARDLARNQSVRRDLYRRGLQGLPVEAYRAQLEALRYGALPAMRASGDLTVAMPIGPIAVEAALVDPIRAHLARGTASFGELIAAHPAGHAPGALIRAVLMLMAAGEIHPVTADGADGAGALRLNRLLAEEGAGPGWLAAPGIGSAIAVDATEMAVAGALFSDPALEGEALLAAARQDAQDWDEERGVAAVRFGLPLWRALGAVPA